MQYQKERPLGLSFFILIIFGFFSTAYGNTPLSDFNPSELPEKGDGFLLEGTSFLADNAFPLQALFYNRGWDGPFNPGMVNTGDLYWKTDIGVVYRGIRFAVFDRGELFIEANQDAVDILRMTHLRQDLPIGRVYNVDLKVNGFSATGLEVSKGISFTGVFEGLSAGISARYLVGERIQTGEVSGRLTPTGPNTYDFNLLLDYVYDQNLLYDRKDTVPGTGRGYSFDFGLKYILNNQIKVECLTRDLFGKIYWKKVPFTNATATSVTKSYDAQGYQTFSPTIQGYEFYRDFTQYILVKTDLSVSYRINTFTFTPTINWIDTRPLYWFDLEFMKNANFALNTGYNTNYKILYIGGAFKNSITLKFYFNGIEANSISGVGLTLALTDRK